MIPCKQYVTVQGLCLGTGRFVQLFIEIWIKESLIWEITIKQQHFTSFNGNMSQRKFYLINNNKATIIHNAGSPLDNGKVCAEELRKKDFIGVMTYNIFNNAEELKKRFTKENFTGEINNNA